MFKKIVGISFLVSMLITGSGCGLFDKRVIEIAVATDVSKSGKETDTIFLGADLMVQEFNQRGGILGMPLVLSVYDDEGTAEGARKAANQIIEDNRAIAVIGHRLSDASIAAGPIYAANNIPVMTPASTSPDVTKDNDWYFRSIFDNDFLGRFMAHYVANVLQSDLVYVAHGESNYEKKLAEVFISTASTLGIKTAKPILIHNEESEESQKFNSIVQNLKLSAGKKVIFLALYPNSATPLIKAIRDQAIDIVMLGPDTLAKESFPRAFVGMPSEKRKPGFYTDGVQVASPLVFDTANWRAGLFREDFVSRYKLAPDWRAAYAYDTAGTFIEAIQRSKIFENEASTTQDIRLAIRDELVKMKDFDTAYLGITGPNFFDAKGDANKPVAIAEFQARELVSAYRQLQTLSQVPTGARLEQVKEDLGALDIGGVLMEKTNVVYTGIDIDQISNLEPRSMKVELSGYIWFRYKMPKEGGQLWRGGELNFDPANIEFNNAIGEVNLKPDGKLEISGDTYYQRFTFDGTFRTDFVSGLKKYGSPTIGISYRHQTKPSGLLLYVPDVVGMGLTGGQSFEDTLGSARYALLADGWVIDKASIFQGTKWARIHGQPGFLNATNARNPHSMITVAIRVGTPNSLSETLQSLMLEFGLKDPENAKKTLIVLVVLAFLCFFIARRLVQGSARLFVNVIQLLVWAGLITVGREVVFNTYQVSSTFDHLQLLDRAFSACWWVFGAIVIDGLVRNLLDKLEQQSKRKVTGVARKTISVIIYLAAGFGVVAFVLDRPITSLLATSGLITFIIGLAIQGNLANVFSGLVISLEKLFVVGDFVQIGETEGIVVDTGWRTTKLRLPIGHIVTIPNDKTASAEIINRTHSAKTSDRIAIFVSPQYPPNEVIRLCEEALDECFGPNAQTGHGGECGYGGVTFDGMNAAANYSISWLTDNYQRRWYTRMDVRKKIYEKFTENGWDFMVKNMNAEKL